ncbi:hypothetical protein AGROH133_14101 [Agrobacterium tumefaciens]|nr:hypothetical protein AGROH133_14101 [Agrobacterium tumefaciens]
MNMPTRTRTRPDMLLLPPANDQPASPTISPLSKSPSSARSASRSAICVSLHRSKWSSICASIPSAGFLQLVENPCAKQHFQPHLELPLPRGKVPRMMRVFPRGIGSVQACSMRSTTTLFATKRGG